MKFSDDLNKKIEELRKLQADRQSSYGQIKAYNEKITNELHEAEEKLHDAVLALGDNPNEEARKRENEARRKVAALRLEASGAQDRSGTIFRAGNAKIAALTDAVLKQAKAEVTANFNENKGEALEKIAAAKQQYLAAAKAYHDLAIVDGQKKYYDLARDIGASDRAAKDNEPRLSVHRPIYTYRGDGTNPYGIIPKEVNDAWMDGVTP